MKNIYFSLLFCLITGLYAHSQIVISDKTLPAVGDTLRVAFDGMPGDLQLGTAGPDKTWDFSGLQGLSMENIVLDASTGPNFGSFPTANQRVEVTASQEVYYSTTSDQVALLGFAGDDPFGFGIQSVLPYSPPNIERQLPMNYEDNNTYNTQLQIEFSTATLPSNVLDQIPPDVDSLRVTIDIERFDEVDAYGEVTMPSRSFAVLREKRREYTTPKLEAKVGNLPWADITLLVQASFPELRPDTSFSYYFWGDAKEPIAIVDVNPMDESEIEAVTYKTDDKTVDIPFIKRNRVDLIAYPNPAVDEVRFDFRNLKPGNYKLVIYNILGQEVWGDSYRINGNRTIGVDLERLRKGTYLYSLIGENEKPLTTKRLMVLKP